MKPRLAWLGYALVIGAMVFATIRVFQREAVTRDPETRHLRFAHTLLDAGLRETLAALARDYEQAQAARGQKVRVHLLDIPDRPYAQWVRTQLIGGTAPEIVMTTGNAFDDGLTARFLVPFGPYINEVNPWNAGTALETQPWRNTFFDGMDTSGFNFRLADHFGVPLSASTVRIYANRPLLRQALARPGRAALRARLRDGLVPESFEDFLALAEAINAHGKQQGRPLVPMAASDTSSRYLLDTLVSTETQRLLFAHDRQWDRRLMGNMAMAGVLEGTFPLNGPEVRSGLARVRAIAPHLQPGFLQLRRDDATFFFTQERAAMIAASSWDAPSFRQLIGGRFDLVIFPLPTVGADSLALGPNSEANVVPQAVFSVVNYHPPGQIALAVDFLRYLTSQPVNERFSQSSGWIPAVVGARPSPAAEPFMPLTRGYPGGPAIHLATADLRRLAEINLHLLFGQEGSVDRYLAALLTAYRGEIPGVMRRTTQRSLVNVANQDTLIAAFRQISHRQPNNTEAARRLGMLIDSSDGNEYSGRRTLRYLDQRGPASSASLASGRPSS